VGRDELPSGYCFAKPREATRRTQEAYDDIDASVGTELALKEYLIYGLGAAVVLFGTFYIILKRRKK
jgi:hypothetical protein